jgi:hypothetical protein
MISYSEGFTMVAIQRTKLKTSLDGAMDEEQISVYKHVARRFETTGADLPQQGTDNDSQGGQQRRHHGRRTC